MRRVLLVQPSLQPPGGGNSVAAWMLQALVAQHRVTVLSWRPVEIEPINRFFGTRLLPSEFDTIVMPRSWTAVPERLPVPAALLRMSLLMRYTRRVSDAFDVVIGAHNETDYGRRGIQYVHYPTYLRPRPKVDLRWYHRPAPVLQGYYRLADRLAGISPERLTGNLTLANSDWTADRLRRLLGIDAQTVYPPVGDPAPGVPWEQRRPEFLAIGRLSPEKEFERIMRVLARVRAERPEVRLTIVGTADRHARRYLKELRRLAGSLGSWITFEFDLARVELRGRMAAARYGIHGMREEHFGIAPAEMARAGALVWVPRGGGQTEIVGDEPALTYDSEAEAAEKIVATLASDAEQQRLRDHLARHSLLFSTERFVREIQTVVREFRE